MAVQRPARQLGKEIKNRRQPGQAKKHRLQIVLIPPVHRRLEHAARRRSQQQQRCRRKNPRKPEQRPEHKPLRRIQRPRLALPKSEHPANSHQHVGQQQKWRDRPRHFKRLVAGPAAAQNGPDTPRHRRIPGQRSHCRHRRSRQARPPQPAEQPQPDPQRGGNAKSIKQRGIGRRADAAVGEHRPGGQHQGVMQL